MSLKMNYDNQLSYSDSFISKNAVNHSPIRAMVEVILSISECSREMLAYAIEKKVMF